MRVVNYFGGALAGTVLAFGIFGDGARAGVVAPGFNNLGTVAICDDCFTGSVSLGFSANFFGATYTSAFVSNNGYLTFNTGQGVFTPFGLGAGYVGQPIIAPFFGDVDTRGAGGGTVTYGAGVYKGAAAFGVTWNAVGYYGAHTDKLNTFQVILTDQGGGDFDIYFNYDQIQWETGDASGGSNGLGGTSAAVGYSKGTAAPGTYGQLAGSLTNGTFLDGGPNSLVANSNIGVAGQYLFRVENGVVTPGVPEPSTWALMLIGFGGLAFAAHRRRRAAVAA